ncbi:MAG: hypothetical protein QM666_01450 [Acinetobacter sp.]
MNTLNDVILMLEYKLSLLKTLLFLFGRICNYPYVVLFLNVGNSLQQ